MGRHGRWGDAEESDINETLILVMMAKKMRGYSIKMKSTFWLDDDDIPGDDSSVPWH